MTVMLEVVATVSLRASQGFTVWWFSAISLAGYAGAVVLLSRVLRYMPMSLAYVIWTGADTAGVLGLSILLFGDTMTGYAWAGIVLVVVGVIMINAHGRSGPRSEPDHGP